MEESTKPTHPTDADEFLKQKPLKEEPHKRPDPLTLKPAADAALELFQNKAWTEALLALRKEWHAEQMLPTTSDKRALELTYYMRALEIIPQRVKKHIDDYRLALSRQSKERPPDVRT